MSLQAIQKGEGSENFQASSHLCQDSIKLNWIKSIYSFIYIQQVCNCIGHNITGMLTNVLDSGMTEMF